MGTAFQMNHRSTRKEYLDRPDIPFEDIRRNMMELDYINTKLGGHRITCMGLEKLLSAKPLTGPVRVLEIGCGGGDNLRALKNWGEKRGWPLELTGVDLNPHCIRYARSRPENNGIRFFESDFARYQPDAAPDIVFASLFCHHFSNEELAEVFRWMNNHCRTGFFINDLHRHPLAYHSIRWLTKWFSKSYLVKHDAPLSVSRGFRRKELASLLQSAGITTYRIHWKWAFRWMVLVNHVN